MTDCNFLSIGLPFEGVFNGWGPQWLYGVISRFNQQYFFLGIGVLLCYTTTV